MGCVPDPVASARFVRDIYERVGAPEGTRFTVPILFDRKTGRIVSNESSEIIRAFNSGFGALAKHAIDLYPPRLQGAIDAANEWVYASINNGVYKCGFAQTQAAYGAAFAELASAMDRVEVILATSRYIAGDALTEADVRLFVSLIRFDSVYAVHFKTNMRCVRERPHTLGYVRELFQIPAIRRSVNLDHCRNHYFASHTLLNPYAIVPPGVGDALWDEPHGRDSLPCAPAS